MDAHTSEAIIRAFLQQIRQRLEEATSMAKAAEACPNSGNIGKGVEIVLDVEPPTYEANTLLNAASMIKRLCNL